MASLKRFALLLLSTLFTQNWNGYPTGGAAFPNEYHFGLVAGITAILLIGLIAAGFTWLAHAVKSANSKSIVDTLIIRTDSSVRFSTKITR